MHGRASPTPTSVILCLGHPFASFRYLSQSLIHLICFFFLFKLEGPGELLSVGSVQYLGSDEDSINICLNHNKCPCFVPA